MAVHFVCTAAYCTNSVKKALFLLVLPPLATYNAACLCHFSSVGDVTFFLQKFDVLDHVFVVMYIYLKN